MAEDLFSQEVQLYSNRYETKRFICGIMKYGIRNLLRYGIGTECHMESSRSDVWHQAAGKMHAGA